MKGFIDYMRTSGFVGIAAGFVFGKAVSDLVGALVADIINPVIGIGTGQLKNLSSMSLDVFSASIAYGSFILAAINFIIIVLIMYLALKKLRLEGIDRPKQPKA